VAVDLSRPVDAVRSPDINASVEHVKETAVLGSLGPPDPIERAQRVQTGLSPETDVLRTTSSKESLNSGFSGDQRQFRLSSKSGIRRWRMLIRLAAPRLGSISNVEFGLHELTIVSGSRQWEMTRFMVPSYEKN